MPKPLAFAELPIEGELKRGEAIYYHGKGLDRVLEEDRKVFGRWFDGRTMRDVDQAVWLSPSLVSRWLGYLNAREKWSVRDLDGRWKEIAHRLDGKLTFLVQLGAFPKQEDLLELGDAAPANSTDATQARFQITTPVFLGSPAIVHQESSVFDSLLDPVTQALTVFKSNDRERLYATPWYALMPELSALVPEFERACPRSPYDGLMGDYTLALYLVQTPVPKDPPLGMTLALRVFTKRRQRAANFPLYYAPSGRNE